MKTGETQNGITHKFVIGDKKGYVTVVLEDKRITDLFVEIDKEGSDVGGWVRAWAVLMSKALQNGVPLSDLVSQFRGWQFGHDGWTKTPGIEFAKSIPDYVVRWLDQMIKRIK